jgi:hypothetical protein
MNLRAIYTIPEIARMAGISRQRAGRLLEAGGVDITRVGRARIVPLAAIQQAMPLFWESILQRECAVNDSTADRT